MVLSRRERLVGAGSMRKFYPLHRRRPPPCSFCTILLYFFFFLVIVNLHFVTALNEDLSKRGAMVGTKLSSILPSQDELFYPSYFEVPNNSRFESLSSTSSGTTTTTTTTTTRTRTTTDTTTAATSRPTTPRTTPMKRGFCNWLIPHKIMIGQYPGCNPEWTMSPTTQDVKRHLHTMIHDVGITLFCSLQSEVPSQNDDGAWKNQKLMNQNHDNDSDSDGVFYLPDRRRFPNPFSHYAPIIRSLQPECKFIHYPIVDLGLPTSISKFEALLSDLVNELIDRNNNDGCIYIHCWGGRGRAGLVGGCLLSLLFPQLDAETILQWVQIGYDSRLGSNELIPFEFSKSPQTKAQRNFVRNFVQHRQQVMTTSKQ